MVCKLFYNEEGGDCGPVEIRLVFLHEEIFISFVLGIGEIFLRRVVVIGMAILLVIGILFLNFANVCAIERDCLGFSSS